MTNPAVGASVRSAALALAMAMVQPVVDTEDPLLILGETGTGKTVLARQIHGRSGRNGPFRELTIPSIPEALQQSMLFGHSKGSFTGATRDTAGYIEEANGGTLFLEEIGEAPPSIQAGLLRVLETGTVTRLGEVRPRPVSVRIIAATNRNVDDPAVFRFDLLQRFGPFRVTLPPLCERPEEILPLFLEFLAEQEAQLAGREQSEADGRPVTLDPGVERLLLAVPWKGNLRQLHKEARWAGAHARGERPIQFKHLSPSLQAEGEVALQKISPEAAQRRAAARLHARVLRELERGDLRAVAARLKISQRRLYQILADPTAGWAA